MSAAKKVLLIMWKNWLFRKRQKIMTAFELIIPALLAIVLVIIRTKGGDSFAIHLKDGEIFPSQPILDYALTGCFYGEDVKPTETPENDDATLILYTPENAFTRRAVKCIKDYYNTYMYFPVTFQNVSNEKVMEEYAKQYKNLSQNFWGGIAFVNEFPADGSIPSMLHYKIRTSYQTKSMWNTDKLLPEFQLAGPGYFSSSYRYSKFILVQHLISMFFIGQNTRKNISSLKVSTQEFPYPPYYSDNGFGFLMESMLPLFLCISYVFVSPTLIKRIVCEKELGIKELMKMMGLHGWVQWLGWFFTSFIVMGISAIIITILLFVPFSENAAVFNKSEPFLFLIILLLYISCSITFCFFISSFFTKPSVASGGGALIWIMTFTVPFYTLQNSFDALSTHEKLSLALLPNMAMAICLRSISAFEGRNLGLQWEYLLYPGTVGDNICVLQVMGMMILDILMYSLLTWYIDNVFPGGYGTKKPFYFLFTKSYWCSGSSGHKGSDSQNEKGDNFEDEPIFGNL